MQHVPTPFGHEFAGEIVAVDADVADRWRPGMRVVAANSAPCNHCHYCRLGRQSLCENLSFLWGAYAEYIAIPSAIVEHNLYEIPDLMSFEAAALLSRSLARCMA